MEVAKQYELLKRLRAGDEAMFKKVYDDNRAKFLNYARKHALDEEECIDIYQDAYITFYQNIISGKLAELTSALSTYLFGIGKFLIMKKLEKNKKTLRSEKILKKVGNDQELLNDWDLRADILTHEQQLLKAHFAQLGEQCQKLLTLFYYRGFSIKEIIKAGGYRNENVVKSQKSRCLKTLKDRIHKPL